MIVDWIKIYVKAGSGGQGAVTSLSLSSRRVIGGGGDGGKGGNVILKVSPHLYDLNKFNERKKFIANSGDKGSHNNRKGKSAQGLVIFVPKGTAVWSLDEKLIVDLIDENQEFVICKGGKAGEGNFKKLYSLPPESGEEKEIYLDYRICADVAVVGFANCGKTSLVNLLTGKDFKVADYPFTTKACTWAKVNFNSHILTVMDTPPLRKKAKERGFSNDFLKHLERPKVILLVSDNSTDFKQEFKELKREIASSQLDILEDKKVFYLLNKTDTIDKVPKTKGILPISVKTGKGIEELKQKILKSL